MGCIEVLVWWWVCQAYKEVQQDLVEEHRQLSNLKQHSEQVQQLFLLEQQTTTAQRQEMKRLQQKVEELEQDLEQHKDKLHAASQGSALVPVLQRDLEYIPQLCRELQEQKAAMASLQHTLQQEINTANALRHQLSLSGNQVQQLEEQKKQTHRQLQSALERNKSMGSAWSRLESQLDDSFRYIVVWCSECSNVMQHMARRHSNKEWLQSQVHTIIHNSSLRQYFFHTTTQSTTT